jgi:hypothetical protein
MSQGEKKDLSLGGFNGSFGYLPQKLRTKEAVAYLFWSKSPTESTFESKQANNGIL